jgi:hypothetical protein
VLHDIGLTVSIGTFLSLVCGAVLSTPLRAEGGMSADWCISQLQLPAPVAGVRA